MLACLEKAGLLFKSEKYKFYKESVIFLEFVVIIKNIEINLEKVKTVQNWLILYTIKKI